VTTTIASHALPRNDSASPSMRMMEMLYGALAAQLISVAAELEIADQLADGPAHVDDIAKACGANANGVYRLLRALASLGVFTESSARTFALTPLAETLRTGVTGSMKDIAQDVGGRTRLLAYSQLAHSVRTGQPAFDHAHGTSMWAYLQSHPAELALFGKAMGNLASQVHAKAFLDYDLSDVRRLIDLGGGEGYLIATLLAQYPNMRATVFDEPHVASRAAEVFARAGLLDRADIATGDMFESVPAGGDVYVLSSILFSYEDADVRKVLSNVRDAMTADGRILVLEPLIHDGNEPHPAKLLDVCQLALHRGGIRTDDEWEVLFRSVGLRLAEAKVMWPDSPTDLIVAVRA
jgi:hypothetical protein